MAVMIPETVAPSSAPGKRGERKVFEALRKHLPEDYLVYYDVSVKRRHPDFIVIGPDLGVVVLEVKDWRADSILDITADGVVLRDKGGECSRRDPVQQAREYTLRIVDQLKARSLLYDGKYLRCRWGYGVIFPHLKQDDLERPALFGPSLQDAIGEDSVLCAEDLDREALLPALRRLMPDWVPPQEPLNALEVDEIRAAIHPEIRIGWGRTDKEVQHAMDQVQERIARTLGQGHHLIRGVAGSGKTVCLLCRVQHLRECHPDWRILVLCYNRVLADYLRGAIGNSSDVEVLHYHRWCCRTLEAGGIPIPPRPEPGPLREHHWNQVIPGLILEGYERGCIPIGHYQAVLIDEGQDFCDDWYRVILRALDPHTDSLFIALDSSQDIYRRKVSWRDVGIQVVGRSKVLRVNYRNTWAILSKAYALIRDLDQSTVAVNETGGEYVVPEKALRDGPSPDIKRFRSFEDERRHALEWVRARLASGVAPEDVLVLGLSRLQMAELEVWLQDAGIQAQLLGGRGRAGVVRLSTIHSAKGLDAEHVLVIGVHQLAAHAESDSRRLLYIAMTRARTELCLSFSGPSTLLT